MERERKRVGCIELVGCMGDSCTRRIRNFKMISLERSRIANVHCKMRRFCGTSAPVRWLFRSFVCALQACRAGPNASRKCTSAKTFSL